MRQLIRQSYHFVFLSSRECWYLARLSVRFLCSALQY